MIIYVYYMYIIVLYIVEYNSDDVVLYFVDKMISV
jgi:hypothetical protein